MTQRSIQAGKTPTVIIRAGADIQIEGWDDERILANTQSRWGLKVERRSASEIARIRARVGDHTLFDVHLDAIGRGKKKVRAAVIEATLGSSGRVYVPLGSSVKVYAGKSVTIQDIQGDVSIYAGGNVRAHNIHTLVHVSAGGAMDLECDTLVGDEVKFTAGRDLHFHVHELPHAKLMLNDLGGYWQGIIGDGGRKIRLEAGGDVTLVTDQPVKGRPPDNILGAIEGPNEKASDDDDEPKGRSTGKWHGRFGVRATSQCYTCLYPPHSPKPLARWITRRPASLDPM
jgi:hypothetical protein